MRHGKEQPDLTFLREDPHQTWPEAWRRLAPDVEEAVLRASAPGRAHSPRIARRPLPRHAVPFGLAAAATLILSIGLYLAVFHKAHDHRISLTVQRTDSQSENGEIQLGDGAGLQLLFAAHSLFEVRSPNDAIGGPTVILLRRGVLRYISQTHKKIVIETGRGRYVPVGTAFTLRTDGLTDTLSVEAGLVRLETGKDEPASVSPGETIEVTARGRAAAPARSTAEEGDTVILKNGEVLRGTLTMTGQTYYLQTSRGRRTIPREQLLEIRMHAGKNPPQ